jgi:hypothetical protein
MQFSGRSDKSYMIKLQAQKQHHHNLAAFNLHVKAASALDGEFASLCRLSSRFGGGSG